MASSSSAAAPLVVPPRASNFNWTDKLEELFIAEMSDQCLQGRRSGAEKFNSLAWIEMGTHLNSLPQFQATSMELTKTHMYNRLRAIRKHYQEMSLILKQSGFGWDHEAKMVTAELEVWMPFEQGNPWASGYKNKSLVDWDSLCLIFNDNIADGSCSSHPDDPTPVANTNDASSTQYGPNTNDASGTQSGIGLGTDSQISFTAESSHTTLRQPRQRGDGPSTSCCRRGANIGERLLEKMQQYTHEMILYRTRPNLEEQWMPILKEMREHNIITEELFMVATFKLSNSQLAEAFLLLDEPRRFLYIEAMFHGAF